LSALNQIYFDTNVWIAYLLQDPDQYAIAKKQIERILSGEEIGLISFLVLCEIIDVAKKVLLEPRSYKGNDKTYLETIKADINARVRAIVERIITLEKEGKLIIVNSECSLETCYRKIFEILPCLNDEIVRNNYCPKCDRRIDPPGYKYRKLGHFDIQHAFTAKEKYATEIVTFDKAFPQLHQLKGFEKFPVNLLEVPRY
jgi:predicted nucleic acid-binding protein